MSQSEQSNSLIPFPFRNTHQNVELLCIFQTNINQVEHRQWISVDSLRDIRQIASEIQQKNMIAKLQSSKQSSQCEKQNESLKINIITLQINLQLQNNQLYQNCTKIIKILCEADLTQLKSFTLKNAKISEKGIRILVNQTNWPKLQSLDLFYCGLNENSLKQINKAKWNLIGNFDINSNQIQNQGMYYISESKVINPKIINLQRCAIGCQGLKTLSKGKNKLQNLQIINLNENLISDQGFQALSLMNWPKLKKISLDYNKITSNGIQCIRKVNWPQLQFFSIVNNQINGNALQSLGLSHFPNLISFNLSFNRIGNKIYNFLAKSNMKKLQSLILTNMKITLCPDFRAADIFSQLKYVNLQGNQIPQQKLRKFCSLIDENDQQQGNDNDNNSDYDNSQNEDEESQNSNQYEIEIQY